MEDKEIIEKIKLLIDDWHWNVESGRPNGYYLKEIAELVGYDYSLSSD